MFISGKRQRDELPVDGWVDSADDEEEAPEGGKGDGEGTGEGDEGDESLVDGLQRRSARGL